MVGLLVAWVWTLVVGRLRAGRPVVAALSRPWCGMGLGVFWFGLVSVVYSATGAFSAWYLLVPLAGWVVLAGSMAEGMIRTTRESDRWRRWGAVAGLIFLLGLLGGQVRYSPVVHRYEEWERASEASREFLADLEHRIEVAKDGAVLAVSDLPMRVQVPADRPAVRAASILTDYSVQAWADLTFPQRRVRVRTGERVPEVASPGEVLIVLTGRKPGF